MRSQRRRSGLASCLSVRLGKLNRHHEERSDVVIQEVAEGIFYCTGLPRCARKDGFDGFVRIDSFTYVRNDLGVELLRVCLPGWVN